MSLVNNIGNEKNKNKPPLKIGFDLDGVILYNPSRILRPIVSCIKKQLFHRKKLNFFYPKNEFQRYIWKLVHMTSLYIPDGFNTIKELSKQNKIEPYIITARFGFLKPQLESWAKRNHIRDYFKEIYINEEDKQPHIHKEQKIRELGLDYFVEDNLDIVLHLRSVFPDKKIIWIYNIFDKNFDYDLKFPTLKKMTNYLLEQLKI